MNSAASDNVLPALLDVMRAYLLFAPDDEGRPHDEVASDGLLSVAQRLVSGDLTSDQMVQLSAAVREYHDASNRVVVAYRQHKAAEEHAADAWKAMRALNEDRPTAAGGAS